MSPAKTAEPIDMSFGLKTWVGPGNHVLDGGPDPPMGTGNFEGERTRSVVKYSDCLLCCELQYANTAESMAMPFGIWSRVGPSKN